jgi:hypothetical protein
MGFMESSKIAMKMNISYLVINYNILSLGFEEIRI